MSEHPPLARTARTTATLVVALVPAALVVSGVAGRAVGRGVLLAAAATAVLCLTASVGLLRRDAHAWLLVLGAVSVLGGGGYLWTVRNVPAAIPVGGFLAMLLGLVLLAVGALVVRPTST